MKSSADRAIDESRSLVDEAGRSHTITNRSNTVQLRHQVILTVKTSQCTYMYVRTNFICQKYMYMYTDTVNRPTMAFGLLWLFCALVPYVFAHKK